MPELRQTSEYAKYLSLLGWSTRKLDGENVYCKKIPVIGSIIKLQRPENIVSADKLKKLAKDVRAFNIIIECSTKKQYEHYVNSGFKSLKNPSLPSKTTHINLKSSRHNLSSHLHHKSRYNIGLSKRKGVKIINTKDVNSFSQLWHKCARKRKMYFSQEKEITSIFKAFLKKSIMLLATKDREVLAGVLIISSNSTSHYMYAASTESGYRYFAPTLLAWEAITRSKERGLKIFDFEGIYDERFPLAGWKGFSRFKKSFGGTVVEYPGPLGFWRIPV